MQHLLQCIQYIGMLGHSIEKRYDYCNSSTVFIVYVSKSKHCSICFLQALGMDVDNMKVLSAKELIEVSLLLQYSIMIYK